jgi:NAD(P)H-hydrate repair Nnr-like enzyme with NAD(P)H-hydrate dehydratase domain
MTATDYWQKQAPNTPLFEDIMWSRPEHKSQAGKLLIAGGNSFGFAAPATAYNEATDAGVGIARVLLPASLHKMVGAFLPDAQYAPNNPSGGLAKNALEPLITNATWADAVLLAGEFGRNSETAVMLERFVTTWHGLLVLTHDAGDYFLKSSLVLLKRPQTALFLSIEQLQKFGTHAKYPKPLLFAMDITHTVEWLHEFTLLYPITIVTSHHDQFVIAHGGQVVTQKADPAQKIWRVKRAARASVFWLQNPSKPLQAIATSFVIH